MAVLGLVPAPRARVVACALVAEAKREPEPQRALVTPTEVEEAAVLAPAARGPREPEAVRRRLGEAAGGVGEAGRRGPEEACVTAAVAAQGARVGQAERAGVGHEPAARDRPRHRRHVRGGRVGAVVDQREGAVGAGGHVDGVGLRGRDRERDRVVRALVLLEVVSGGAHVDADGLGVAGLEPRQARGDDRDGGGTLIARDQAVRELVRAVGGVLDDGEARDRLRGRPDCAC